MATQQNGFFGVRSKPPLELLKLFILFVLLAALLWVAQPQSPDYYAGAVLVFFGEIIRIWAAGHLTRDQRLSVSGPYEYTRNPFYLGRFLLIVGFAIMAGIRSNVWVLAICVVALAIFFFYYMPRKDKREGGRLSKLFGEEYDRWRANVPVLLPRLTPYRTNPRPWSRELFMTGDDQFTGNKEIWTALVVLALAAFLYWRMVTPH
jgi:protein-S-isoprenylcysteine O-methyltransferase Ste14